MATAHIEWDHGQDWSLEEYEDYLKYLEIAKESDWDWKNYAESLRELNHRLGFPGPNGEML